MVRKAQHAERTLGIARKTQHEKLSLLAGCRELVGRERDRLDDGALVGRQHGGRVESQRSGDLLRAEHRAVEGAHGVVESGGPQDRHLYPRPRRCCQSRRSGMVRALRGGRYFSWWARATRSSRPKVSRSLRHADHACRRTSSPDMPTAAPTMAPAIAATVSTSPPTETDLRRTAAGSSGLAR